MIIFVRHFDLFAIFFAYSPGFFFVSLTVYDRVQFGPRDANRAMLLRLFGCSDRFIEMFGQSSGGAGPIVPPWPIRRIFRILFCLCLSHTAGMCSAPPFSHRRFCRGLGRRFIKVSFWRLFVRSRGPRGIHPASSGSPIARFLFFGDYGLAFFGHSPRFYFP